MRVSEFLADLTSLQACDPSASIALVSARPQAQSGRENGRAQGDRLDDGDADLKRAKDLLTLHATVKQAHRGGTDRDLHEAREAVAKALRTL